MMQSGYSNDVNVKPPNILVFTTTALDQTKDSILKKVKVTTKFSPDEKDFQNFLYQKS